MGNESEHAEQNAVTQEQLEELAAEKKAAEAEELQTDTEEAVDELSLLQKANHELEDRLARTQAELANYRRRTMNEMEQFRKFEGVNLVRDLLPALDNLQRAIDASAQASNVEQLKTGVEMVSKQFLEVLAKYKVQKIEAEGQPFDPNLHEAVQQVPSDDVPVMHVVQDLETGYQLHDRIVRPAKVLVSTGPMPSEKPEEN